MQESLEKLCQKRTALYQKFEKLGNFRRGTIAENYTRCGKKNCACVQEGHPGHGPHYLWSTTVQGKSYSKRLKSGPALQQCLDEIDNYHAFQTLCAECITVNEQICDLHPASTGGEPGEGEALKKNCSISSGRDPQRSSGASGLVLQGANNKGAH